MMKKASSFRVLCLSICFALFLPLLFAGFGETATVPPEDVLDEIDQLIQMVEDTERDDWKWSSRLRKAIMLKKLNVVREQIQDVNFGDAYDKMLHDIKPKLTGLKTDENEDPWAKRRFKRSWISSPDLKVEFRIQCNIVLYLLTQPVIEDDDTTPPTITIGYNGQGHTADPGQWIIEIEDLESGLNEVIIIVDGVVVLHDTYDDLRGVDEISYYIDVPAVEGIHTIEVTAVNNDTDWVGDQESNTVSSSREIVLWIVIIEPPIIIG